MNAAAVAPRAGSGPAEREEARYLWFPLAISLVLLWIVPMASSLGLDESGNWWVVKDGFREMLNRAAIWPGGESVLFNALVVGARSVGGDSDIVMRLPALAAMLATLALIYRIGMKLAGPLAAAFACLAFATMREVIYVASSVRPYALGVLLATGAMAALIEWFDTGRLRYAAGYVLLAALTPYANYVHASMFGVHAIYAAIRLRARDTAVRPGAVLIAWGACALLLLPLARQALTLYARRGQESYLPVPGVEEFLASIAPPVVAGAIAFVFLLTMATRGKAAIAVAAIHGQTAYGWVLAVWALFPPVLLVALSLFTDLKLFAGRYYLVNAPGLALAAGYTLRTVKPVKLGRLIALSMAAAGILAYGFGEHFLRGLHDFRGAVDGIREQIRDPETPVIFVSGFVESNRIANFSDPEVAEALLAPVRRYNLPGHVIGVPGRISEESEAYLDRFVPQLRNQPRFFLTGLFTTEFYQRWLSGRMPEFQEPAVANYGGVLVMRFDRRKQP